MVQAAHWQSPVLESVLGVVGQSSHVHTSLAAIDEVAKWMAYEEFVFPSGIVVGPWDPDTDPDVLIDVIMVTAALNFAFTDFASGSRYEVIAGGRTWSDSEAMYVRVHQAVTSGVPVLDGEWMATVGRADLGAVFSGTIEMPMLDDRAAILNEIGRTLLERYGGRFHRFVRDCPPVMFAGGKGLLDRLVAEFPRYDDVVAYRGTTVRLYKLAQLALWQLHLALGASGGWALADLGLMSAFADYILPVALRRMGILSYSDGLEAKIDTGALVEGNSEEEVEIRSHTLYATALLTDALNALRPDGLRLIIPEVDFRLWKAYHATFSPHHLTRTTMY